MFKTTKMWMDTIALTHEMNGHVNRELLNDLIIKLQFIQQDEDAICWCQMELQLGRRRAGCTHCE